MPRRLIIIALTIAFVPLGTELASAERCFRFRIKARGMRIGKAVIAIGKAKKVGDKKIRRVHVRSKINAPGITAINIKSKSTSWLDGDWLPIKARWFWRLPNGKRKAEARYEGRRIDAHYFRNGKLHKRLKATFRDRPHDLLSLMSWLMTRELSPGQRFEHITYTGSRVYRVSASVGAVETIRVPIGSRKAYPLRVEARRRGKKQKLTLWLGADNHAPYKMSFKYGLLGRVDTELVGSRRRCYKSELRLTDGDGEVDELDLALVER